MQFGRAKKLRRLAAADGAASDPKAVLAAAGQGLGGRAFLLRLSYVVIAPHIIAY
jgi:hypothetical protein